MSLAFAIILFHLTDDETTATAGENENIKLCVRYRQKEEEGFVKANEISI